MHKIRHIISFVRISRRIDSGVTINLSPTTLVVVGQMWPKSDKSFLTSYSAVYSNLPINSWDRFTGEPSRFFTNDWISPIHPCRIYQTTYLILALTGYCAKWWKKISSEPARQISPSYMLTTSKLELPFLFELLIMCLSI